MKGRSLAPGLWIDDAGHIHVALPELLRMVGLPDTAQNRALAQDIAREELEKVLSPEAKIVSTWAQPCPECGSTRQSITGGYMNEGFDLRCQGCGHTWRETAQQITDMTRRTRELEQP